LILVITDPFQIILLLIAGFVAGVINAVAGGGKLLVLPALIASGLPPLTANITSSLVLWPGAAGAAWQYLGELKKVPRKYFLLLIPSFAGALVGTIALQHTSNSVFTHLVPWLMLVGVLFFTLQPYLNKYIHHPFNKRPRLSLIVIGVLLLIASVYGGYFGAGFGFVLMALLGFTNLKSVYQFSAIKNIVGGGMELIGVIYFAIAGGIAWEIGLIAMIGCIAGGIFGARFALKVPQTRIRTIITIVGITLTSVVFMQAYMSS
jgi:uncharacterized membrane protein YfcA